MKQQAELGRHVTPLLAQRLFSLPAGKIALAVLIVAGLITWVKIVPDPIGRFAVAQARAGHNMVGILLAQGTARIANTAQSYYRLGDTYLEAKRYESALASYQETLLRNPQYPGAHAKRARMFFALGDFTQAVSEATEELKLDADHVKARYIRGLALSYDAQWTQAEEDFKQLLRVKDTWVWTRIDLSWVYLAQEKYYLAEDLLEETLETTPGNAWALNNLGLAYMHQGKYTEAQRSFESAREAVQKMTAEQFLQAYPLRKAQDFTAGQQQLGGGIIFNLAVLAEKQGKYSEALTYYEQILAQAKAGEAENISATIRGVTTAQLTGHVAELTEKIK